MSKQFRVLVDLEAGAINFCPLEDEMMSAKVCPLTRVESFIWYITQVMGLTFETCSTS